jgi:hypothetical protein
MESVRRHSLRSLIVAISLMTCCSLYAQANLGGTVVDPDGSAAPSIEVQLKTLQGAQIPDGSTAADAQGDFRILHIAPGDYELEMPAKYGFDQYQAPLVQV